MLFHAIEDWVHKICSLVLGASVKDGVVHDGIVVHATVLHAAQDIHCLVQISFHGIAFHNCGVGDAVWPATVFGHGFHNEQHLIHVANSSLSIDEGVACGGVHPHTPAAHFMPQRHGTLGLPCGCEALHQDGTQHGVGFQSAALLRALRNWYKIIETKYDKTQCVEKCGARKGDNSTEVFLLLSQWGPVQIKLN